MNEMKRVVRECQRKGLLYIHGKKHPKIRDPRTGRTITIAGTPRCPHAFKHVVKDVRKYLQVELGP